MRITESQLRRIIREEILREAQSYDRVVESQLFEATMTAEYQGKTYKASPGVIALLKKYNWDGAKAIADGKFEWAKKRGLNPWSLIQAATIVGTGKPIQRKKATEVV
jgi:hypothetical protein